jgi:hypothetical protein
MPIEANIPLQVQPLKLESPGNQLAMMNEALKYGEMSRSIDEQNKLNEYLKSGADLASAEGRRGLVNYGKTGLGYAKALGEQDKLGLETKKLGVETEAKTFELNKNKIDKAITDIANFPTAQDAFNDIQKRVQAGELPADKANFLIGQLKSMPYEKFQMMQLKNLLGAKDRLTLEETARSNRTNEGIRQGQLDVSRQDLANKYNPTIQGNLAAAKAGGETTGKAVATAQINLPTVIANAEDAIGVIDQMIGKPAVYKDGKVVKAGTKPHPGFQDYVGATLKPGARFIEGTNAAGYEAFQKQLEGKAFTEAFDTLRGGGSITEKEGEKATAAKLRMSKAQNEKEYMEAAREYQGIVRKGVERAKAKAAGGGAAPAGGEIDFNSLK